MWYWINNYRRGAGAYELFGWPCCFLMLVTIWSEVKEILVWLVWLVHHLLHERKKKNFLFFWSSSASECFFKFKLMGATPQLSSHFDCTVAQSCVNVTSAFFHSRPPSSLKHWQTSENSDESAQTVICYITYPHLERVTMLPLQIEHSM